ncbi:MAG: O-antigen/teichoic acid export membrane protein [Francisellaceae bacterium]|jgi:O-antigen/teichoic acid export membrane protein
MSDYKTLLRGSSVRFVTLTCSIFIAFFMMPFIINGVGDKWYGLWVVIASLLSFYGMMDLGLSSATQRFLSYALPQNDKVKLNQYFNSSLLIYTLISLIVIIITAFLIIFADSFIENTTDLNTFKIIFAIMGGTLAISFPFYVVNGVIVANMRYDISAIINLVKIIVRAIAIYYAISDGYGIIAMAMITSATDLLANIVLTFFAMKLAPWIKFGKSFITKDIIKRLFAYSGYAFLGTTADKTKISSAPILIGSILGLNHVTVYAIAAQFVNYFKQLMSAIFSVLFPLFTKNFSLSKNDKQKSDFLLSLKLSSFTSTLGVLVIIVLCAPFIDLWMGERFIQASEILIILILGTGISSCQQPAVQLLMATNNHDKNTWLLVVEATFTLILIVILTPPFGLIGTAISLALPELVVRLFIQPKIVCGILNTRTKDYNLILYKQLLLMAVLIFIHINISSHLILDTYLFLFLYAIFISLSHTIASYFIVLSKHDRLVLSNIRSSLTPKNVSSI